MNRLYNETFVVISFAMLTNFFADTCSPKIRLIEEYAASTAHLSPYRFSSFHPSRSVCCAITEAFLA